MPVLRHKGKVPSIKNRKMIARNRKTGAVHVRSNPEMEAQLKAMTASFAAQWPDAPVEHPDLTVRLYVTNRRPDRDNMLNAVMDALVAGGVLVDDNVKRCNGTLVLMPAVVSKEHEGVEVEVST